MNQPLVSVITPAYNAEYFIAHTIDSVRAQTFTDWEMVIADDCSTDGTVCIIRKYLALDDRIKFISANKNGGSASARNLALGLATGKYIAFLDSDDLWLPEKLERQLGFMRMTGAVFCYTSYRYIDINGESMSRFVYTQKTMTYINVLKNTLIGCLTVMIDREAVGDFRMPLLKHGEDTMTWVDILKRGFVAHGLPEILSEYRITPGSLTRRKFRMAKLHWKNFRGYLGFGLIRSSYYFSCYALNAVLKTSREWKIKILRKFTTRNRTG